MLSGIGSLNLLKRTAKENLVNVILLYTVATVVDCVALILPGIIFAILAGLFFGPVLGTICCSPVTMIGAMAMFLVGGFFLKGSIKSVVTRNQCLEKWLFDEAGRNELFILMITRFVPLFPYNLQNFAYGVTDIPFSTYSIFSLISMLPGTAMHTIGTSRLANKKNRVLRISITVILAVIAMDMEMFLKEEHVVQPKWVEEIDGQKS